MMKKRTIVGACIAAVAVLGVFIAIILLSEEKLTLADRDKVTKILLMSGSTGNVLTLEGDEMAEVLDAVYNVSGKKTKETTKIGWLYSMTFYNGRSAQTS